MTSIRPLNITIVGDGMVGKTSLLITYTQNEFPDEYIPAVFDNQAKNIDGDRKQYNLTFWDTAGQEDYETLRPLNYRNTDCFLLCYSISSRTSFDNVKNKWSSEIHRFSNNVPVVLVGTKLDLRVPTSGKFVTPAEGEKLKQEINAFSIVECSAKKKLHLDTVFEEALSAVYKPRFKNCTIL